MRNSTYQAPSQMLCDESFVNPGISYTRVDRSPKFYIGQIKQYILYVFLKKLCFFSFKESILFVLFRKNRLWNNLSFNRKLQQKAQLDKSDPSFKKNLPKYWFYILQNISTITVNRYNTMHMESVWIHTSSLTLKNLLHLCDFKQSCKVQIYD